MGMEGWEGGIYAFSLSLMRPKRLLRFFVLSEALASLRADSGVPFILSMKEPRFEGVLFAMLGRDPTV